MEGRRVWIHGASLGECKAVLAVARALPAGIQAVLTSTTAAGVERLRADGRFPAYLAPFDTLAASEDFVLSMGITRLLLVEAELWPAWIATASRLGIPVAVVSVRVAGTSKNRWRRLWRLFPDLPQALDRVWSHAGEMPRAREAGFVRVHPGAGLKWAGVEPISVASIPNRFAALSLHRRDAATLSRAVQEWGGGWLLFPRRTRDVPFWRARAAALGLKAVFSPREVGPGTAWVAERFGLVGDNLPGCARAWVSPGHDAWEPLYLGVPEVAPAGHDRRRLDAHRRRCDACLADVVAWLAVP
jgi:3-deoxy-D-manno-octulosonic-acid transferase